MRRGDHRTITTTRAASGPPRHPDLVRRRWDRPTRPDTLWVADFTYVSTLTGFVYVLFITDVYFRRILGWRVATMKTTDLVLSAVNQALATRRRQNSTFTTTELVHHSDAGSQYWYNNERLHSSIGDIPSIEKEMEYASTIASRREVA